MSNGLHSDIRYRIISWIFFLLIFSVFVFMLAISWRKWGGLYIDTFRDQWVALSILHGKILYRDIFYPYGFLPPYFIATLMALFGVNLSVSAGAGIIIAALSSLLVYRIARFFLAAPEACLTVTAFIACFVFGSYSSGGIFNYILPYSFATVVAGLFIMAAVYYFLRFIIREARSDLSRALLFIYLSALSRPDFGLFIFCVLLILLTVYCLYFKKTGTIIRDALLVFAVVVLTYGVFIAVTRSWAGWSESFLGQILLSAKGKNPFDTATSGMGNFSGTLFFIVKLFGYQTLFGLFIGALSYLLGRRAAALPRRALRVAAYVGIGLVLAGSAVFYVYGVFLHNFAVLDLYRSSPVILVIFIACGFYRMVRRTWTTDGYALFCLSALATAMSLRVIFNIGPYHYGFVLGVLSMLVYYIFFFRAGIVALARSGCRACGLYYRGALTVVFLFFIVFCALRNVFAYRAKDFMVSTARGAIASYMTPANVAFWQAAAYISENTPAGATLVAFPEAIGLNFFTGRDNPLRYDTFLPPIINSIGSKKILGVLAAARVDYIAVVTRYTFEYGYPVFGVDYARDIASWINDSYILEKVFINLPFSGRAGGIALYRRKMIK